MRFEVAKKIVERAADYGISREDVVVDPLVMPIGAVRTAGKQVFSIVKRLRDERRFANVDELKAALIDDENAVRKILT